jgi:hypothetical protein
MSLLANFLCVTVGVAGGHLLIGFVGYWAAGMYALAALFAYVSARNPTVSAAMLAVTAGALASIAI